MSKTALVLGLTGQTGAGKSTASRYFETHGCAVIDCDQVARAVTTPGSGCLRELAEAFGGEILTPAGELNRRVLGKLVFSSKEQLVRLNGLIFPYILEEIRQAVRRLEEEGRRLILLDAPTLFESGADRMCRGVLAVTAPEKLRLARIMERDGLSREEALGRMSSQQSEAFFRARADLILENNGSEEAFAGQLAQGMRWMETLLKKEQF